MDYHTQTFIPKVLLICFENGRSPDSFYVIKPSQHSASGIAVNNILSHEVLK